jgi:hypothetical protein
MYVPRPASGAIVGAALGVASTWLPGFYHRPPDFARRMLSPLRGNHPFRIPLDGCGMPLPRSNA